MKTIFAIAATAMLCLPAGAADLPARAPVYAAPVVAPGLSGSGFYVGAFGGGAMTRDRFDFVAVPGTGLMSPIGLIAGGKIGYAGWYGTTLLGIEADAAYNFNDKNASCAVASTCRTDGSILMTQRLVMGWSMGTMVPYITGGLAERHAKASVSGFGDGSRWIFGPTGGAGIRFPISYNVAIDIGYLYTYYNRDFSPVDSAPIFAPTFKAQSEHTIRAGLNLGF